jgi:hypothetical protein
MKTPPASYPPSAATLVTEPAFRLRDARSLTIKAEVFSAADGQQTGPHSQALTSAVARPRPQMHAALASRQRSDAMAALAVIRSG